MSGADLHNLDVEQAVLGSILYENKFLWEIEDIGLRPEQFFDPVHARIFKLCVDLIRSGKLADGVTLTGQMKTDAGLQEIGGAGYIAELYLCSLPDRNSVRDYAVIIANLHTKREVVRIANEAIAKANDPDFSSESGGSLVDATAAALTALETGSDHRSVSASEAINEALVAAQNALKEGAAPSGIHTGLAKMTPRCGLLKPGMVVTIAGRPGMGKSTVALDMCRVMAKSGVGIGYISPEMDAAEHGYRMASSIAFGENVKIPYEEIADGKITLDRLRLIAGCVQAAKKLPFVIDDRGIVPLDRLAMRARAMDRRLKQDFGSKLQVLVIDHLGLIDVPKASFGSNRVQEVSLITKVLKQLARSMGVVVILLAQLNRDVEKRDDKRPKLSDLRESGSIEQDSDQVWLLYREAYYLKKDVEALKAGGKATSLEFDELRERLRKVADNLEIDVAKRRGGGGGREIVKLYAPYSAVRDFPDSNEDQPELEGSF